MSRPHEFTAKIKLSAFDRANGRCEACSCRLVSAEYHHRIPIAMGGESTLENAVCLCAKCHKISTSDKDIPAIAKAKRIERKHKGVTSPKRKMPSRGFRQHASNVKYINQD
jgi:5-methylcytosine-specific restriction enzyme A